VADRSELNRRRALVILGALAVVPIVLGLVLGLVFGMPIVGLVVGVLVAVAVVVLVDRGAEGRVLAAAGAVVADPRREARMLNLVEGLCATIGLTPPAARVVEHPALNGLATAGRRGPGTIVMTRGLLDALGRVELEGVVAELLGRIKQGDARTGTLAAVVLGPLLPVSGPAMRWALEGSGPAEADAAAVGYTRYPPGLAGALAKVQAADAAVPGIRRANAHLWLEPPGDDLPARIEALREL
jgi:heat shock protein HtpX